MSGLYVHVPFCLTRCGYCDFNAYEGLDHLRGRYAEALAREADLAAWGWAGERIDTVFFGGGTPTRLAAMDLVRVLDHLPPVGGTLGNYGDLWRFSHDGNVLAPAAGYPIGDNTYIAGTSFAAPFVSMAAAQWLTYPNACNFNGTTPPLVETAQSKSANQTFVPVSSMPFDCSASNTTASISGDSGASGENTTTAVSYSIESNDPAVMQTGKWSGTATPLASGGNYLSNHVDQADKVLTLVFDGTGINVNYLTGPSLGTFTIVVDDVAIRTVISWSDTAAFGNWSNISGLEPGNHTLQIVATDGTVAIDSFYVVAQ